MCELQIRIPADQNSGAYVKLTGTCYILPTGVEVFVDLENLPTGFNPLFLIPILEVFVVGQASQVTHNVPIVEVATTILSFSTVHENMVVNYSSSPEVVVVEIKKMPPFERLPWAQAVVPQVESLERPNGSLVGRQMLTIQVAGGSQNIRAVHRFRLLGEERLEHDSFLYSGSIELSKPPRPVLKGVLSGRFLKVSPGPETMQ